MHVVVVAVAKKPYLQSAYICATTAHTYFIYYMAIALIRNNKVHHEVLLNYSYGL